MTKLIDLISGQSNLLNPFAYDTITTYSNDQKTIMLRGTPIFAQRRNKNFEVVRQKTKPRRIKESVKENKYKQ